MFLDKLIGLFSNDMAIDLGTANTIVSVRGKGIIINEPSVVAVQSDRQGKDKILAVGQEAKQMIGKTPLNIQAVRPMQDGVIADFEMTERMIRYFIEKAHSRKSFVRPRIIICIPYGITQVEKKAVEESAMSAGAREVFLVEEPMAAAIGAGIPVSDPSGYVVVDIGGGTTEIGVTSLGGLVLCKSIKVAGDKFDRSIVEYVRQNYNLFIGERTAENIKIEIGTAIKLDTELKMKVKGRDNSGLLSTIELGSEGVRTALKEPLKEIVSAIKSVLENMPPDLASDIVDNGVIITGGGALIRGLDTYLSDIIKLPVKIANEPLLSVAYGTSQVLDEPELLRLITNN
ncbi:MULTISPECIES: rod shape-determining protein [Arcobacter]|uniref:Cell shape-determining protein MreB n=1 Tax=Arcobacter ellisii TaxID=913109 RepID=A0A347UBV6_9BACT|nr:MULTISPECIES: rod shape-determining protein [Arcobacter]AXX96334.1 cell wall shape-determining protein [Arcobacter ellisii]MDY3205608.1 rod shape-determining protein [Arcobacter sp.]RXI31826.1 rod shape-determining protein [Arcobacter ellisii]